MGPRVERAHSQHLRILPELRAIHVERSSKMYPCTNLYFHSKYDLGDTPLPESFVRVNFRRALWNVVVSDARVLEVPEPLWLRFAPVNLALILAWKVSGLAQKRTRFTVTYSIENNSFATLITGGRFMPRPVISAAARVAGSLISRVVDRAAFGSHGARDTYRSLQVDHRVETRLFPELPSRSERSFFAEEIRSGVVFVGRLEARKGIYELLAAWPKVEEMIPGARLTIVGGGPLDAVVRDWASKRPENRHVLGFLQHQQLGPIFASHRVAVAPSVPDGRWREQIGLPIGEALSYGLTVVTTSETGIADWLSSNGHYVVPTQQLTSELPSALINALAHPLEKEAVLSSLPLRPNRIAADAWLHSIETEKR
jgi:glycosyltransferase involved in cell wall biosynthesis